MNSARSKTPLKTSATSTPKTLKRLTAIQARLAELNAKLPVYADEQKAKAGVFVSIADDGSLHIEPGFRRQADIIAEAKPAPPGSCQHRRI